MKTLTKSKIKYTNRYNYEANTMVLVVLIGICMMTAVLEIVFGGLF